ncbi:hypothetical protein ABZ832_29690 [Streptantibioticus parmotrematis]|uniref:DNA-3-methyladenine glycosylase family protein n=1 Tax=Streptantibioticus parmotrematis TaxID=2873249 RepID=UPI0033D09964
MNATAERHHAYLAAEDPVFARIIAAYGIQDPFAWHDGGRTGTARFPALFLHVLSQRTSAAAAFTLYDRTAEALGGSVTARGLARLGPSGLRSIGLNDAKAACATDLARAQLAGRIDVEHLETQDDEEVVAALTAFKGLGTWTAQAFLMRQLQRPDVLPAGDTALHTAIQKNWNLPEPPTPSRTRHLAAPWAPSRSYAAALLWRSLVPPGEPYDPKERALRAARQ